MKKFCITQETADKLKQAAKDGAINVESMLAMSSEERRALFEKYVDKETALGVNTGFEGAMVSTQKTALKKWAERTFTAAEKKTGKFNDVITKINNLDKTGVLNPTEGKPFLEDLVASKLGAAVTGEEAKAISEKAQKMETLYKKVDKLGDYSTQQQEQIDFFKARREMEDYLDSLTPSSKLRVLTSTISRGNMLIRVGSVLVNINSNNLQGATEAIVRRVAERSIGGLNPGEMGKLMKFQMKIYNETGYDLSRMMSLESDRKILGEEFTHSQGPGAIRAVGRLYEDLVFKKTQGFPDVVAASLAQSDRMNLMTTRMARGQGLRGDQAKAKALEIFKDASLIEPKTTDGQLVRTAAVADAERSTNTDKRMLSKKALQLRQVLNVGDLRFGDLNIPFVKTTANAVQSGLEASGVTVPLEVPLRLIKMVKLVQESGEGYKSGKAWGSASKEAFSGFASTMVRAGLGFTAAWMVANAIKPTDYIGIYPTTEKERELLRLRNASPNSIKIGNKWYSLDWFGPLFAPIVGHMNAKKYGTDFQSKAYYYATGAAYQVLKTPGLDFLQQTIDGLAKTLSASTGSSYKDTLTSIQNYLVDFTQSRAIPGIVSSIAQLTDDTVRDTNRKKDILAPLKNAIPGLRETLPPARNAFGEGSKTEGWQNLLFGSRVKNAKTDPVIEELVRLQHADQLPSITDVSKTSPRAKELESQIGEEKFNEAMTKFGTKFKQTTSKLIATEAYKNATDEKKSNAIDKYKTKLFEQTLREYGYKKPKK